MTIGQIESYIAAGSTIFIDWVIHLVYLKISSIYKKNKLKTINCKIVITISANVYK